MIIRFFRRFLNWQASKKCLTSRASLFFVFNEMGRKSSAMASHLVLRLATRDSKRRSWRIGEAQPRKVAGHGMLLRTRRRCGFGGGGVIFPGIADSADGFAQTDGEVDDNLQALRVE